MSSETEAGSTPAARIPSAWDSPQIPAVGPVLRSPAAKFFFIGALSVMLLVPLFMVFALNADRQSRRAEATATVAREWGGEQRLEGPILVIPYLEKVTTGTPPLRHLAVLPETYTATVDTKADQRSVSIYDVPVFSSAIAAKGAFGPVPPALFGDAGTIMWDRAYIALGIDDLSGVEAASMVTGGRQRDFAPGLTADGAFLGVTGGSLASGPGIHIPLAETGPIAGFDFTLDLRLRGTGALRLAPVGKQTEVAMKSDWAHPNFAVGLLPSERTVTDAGFTATWRVPYLARATPQTWIVERDGFYRFGGSSVGVGFVSPVDLYALVERALKYGLMFVGVVFLTVFLLETLSPQRIHIVQYCIVGLVLVMFFVLLLAFAERIGFGPAYLIASAATGLVVSAFIGTQLRSAARAGVAALSFAVTFALLYAILLLEDLALLAGAIAGFVILSVVLFATRRVDWSGGTSRPAPLTEAQPAWSSSPSPGTPA